MLRQQFIIDYLNAHSLLVPNALGDSTLVDRIAVKGFELYGESNFPKVVAAINARYPNRLVVPLAGRVSNDDIIALLYHPTDLGQLILFHGWTDPGFERPIYFGAFADWFEWADPSHVV